MGFTTILSTFYVLIVSINVKTGVLCDLLFRRTTLLGINVSAACASTGQFSIRPIIILIPRVACRASVSSGFFHFALGGGRQQGQTPRKSDLRLSSPICGLFVSGERTIMRLNWKLEAGCLTERK